MLITKGGGVSRKLLRWRLWRRAADRPRFLHRAAGMVLARLVLSEKQEVSMLEAELRAPSLTHMRKALLVDGLLEHCHNIQSKWCTYCVFFLFFICYFMI